MILRGQFLNKNTHITFAIVEIIVGSLFTLLLVLCLFLHYLECFHLQYDYYPVK